VLREKVEGVGSNVVPQNGLQLLWIANQSLSGAVRDQGFQVVVLGVELFVRLAEECLNLGRRNLRGDLVGQCSQ